MAEYTPDSWTIIKLTNESTNKTHYRVLCSWSGSYLWGSSWKISSGVESVEDLGDFYRMPQTSGSVYLLYKTQERMSGQMSNILAYYQEQENESGLEIKDMAIEQFLVEWKLQPAT